MGWCSLSTAEFHHGSTHASLPSTFVPAPGSLYVFGNDLTGTWPEAFCPSSKYPNGRFNEFGLNCEQTPCPDECCLPENNCFA